MIEIRGYFNGETIVLDEPFDLKLNTQVIVKVLSEDEKADWIVLGKKSFARAYADDEPEYSLDKIIEFNPEYKERGLIKMNNLNQQASAMFARLSPGDLMILGARPGQGKTQIGLGLAVEAMKSGRRGAFFTLEYNAADVRNLFASIGEEPADFRHAFKLDTSDEINAEYIMAQLAEMPKGTVVVVDYLQLLDQKRENPELAEQIRALKSFAEERGLIMVFLSQIDRSFDASAETCPSLNDIRLPNPLDLKLFNKTCFINGGELQFSAMN